MTHLVSGAWRLELRPEVGGAIDGLTWQGIDVLRPTPVAVAGALDTACFPLVPYANRIDRAAFRFGDAPVRLAPTPGFEPHALHGDGWREPWTVATVEADRAVLTLARPAGDWPWAWSARQAFELTPDGLTVTLSLTNEDARPMPAGVGLHPYFNRTDRTRLTLASDGVWLVDETLIPEALAPPGELFDWADGPRVDAAPFIDNTYAGWNGEAELDLGEVLVTLTAEQARFAHVFVPAGERFFCVEPVSHRPNALNASSPGEEGLVVLAPGETLSMTLRIGARRA